MGQQDISPGGQENVLSGQQLQQLYIDSGDNYHINKRQAMDQGKMRRQISCPEGIVQQSGSQLDDIRKLRRLSGPGLQREVGL